MGINLTFHGSLIMRRNMIKKKRDDKFDKKLMIENSSKAKGEDYKGKSKMETP